MKINKNITLIFLTGRIDSSLELAVCFSFHQTGKILTRVVESQSSREHILIYIYLLIFVYRDKTCRKAGLKRYWNSREQANKPRLSHLLFPAVSFMLFVRTTNHRKFFRTCRLDRNFTVPLWHNGITNASYCCCLAAVFRSNSRILHFNDSKLKICQIICQCR